MYVIWSYTLLKIMNKWSFVWVGPTLFAIYLKKTDRREVYERIKRGMWEHLKAHFV